MKTTNSLRFVTLTASILVQTACTGNITVADNAGGHDAGPSLSDTGPTPPSDGGPSIGDGDTSDASEWSMLIDAGPDSASGSTSLPDASDDVGSSSQPDAAPSTTLCLGGTAYEVAALGPLSAPIETGYCVVGADDNLWCSLGNGIARMTSSGVLTEFAIPSAATSYTVLGSDGNVWATTATGVASITPAGVVSSFNYTSDAGAVTKYGMTVGADGNIWLLGSAGVSSVTTSGIATSFASNGATMNVASNLMATGPDGNVWYADGSQFVRVTPAGAMTTFPYPSETEQIGGLAGAATGIWIGGATSGTGFPPASWLAYLDMDGGVTKVAISADTSGWEAAQLAVDSTGAVWYTYVEIGLSLGRTTPAGVSTIVPDPFFPGSTVNSVATSADGSIWVLRTPTSGATTIVERITMGGACSGTAGIPAR